MNRVIYIADVLNTLYPDAACELVHRSALELTVAVMLSAQTTDKQVNKVTPALFAAYPTLTSYATATPDEVAVYIRSLGLYRSKARNLVGMAQKVLTTFDGKIPDTIDELVQLPGIGRKTANVVINVWFGHPGFAVDTHVERIAKRLQLVPETSTIDATEKLLKGIFPQERWGKLHHQMIFFGRYWCTARRPNCDTCPLQQECSYYATHNDNEA